MTSQSSQTLTATVEAPDRLDRFLALAFPEVSRARFQRLIAEGQVSVEGVPATETRHKLKAGQRVEAVIPPAVTAEPRAETIPLTVVH
jgi:23S rRNA pseudouridine1911/1915/1917 synthase